MSSWAMTVVIALKDYRCIIEDKIKVALKKPLCLRGDVGIAHY
jgi:hypothetical protein